MLVLDVLQAYSEFLWISPKYLFDDPVVLVLDIADTDSALALLWLVDRPGEL